MASSDERDELYDLEADPAELKNVAADPSNADVVTKMKARLAAWRSDTGDGPAVPLPTPEHYTEGGYFRPRVRC
jgi:uncharacterized sulfatase